MSTVSVFFCCGCFLSHVLEQWHWRSAYRRQSVSKSTTKEWNNVEGEWKKMRSKIHDNKSISMCSTTEAWCRSANHSCCGERSDISAAFTRNLGSNSISFAIQHVRIEFEIIFQNFIALKMHICHRKHLKVLQMCYTACRRTHTHGKIRSR